MHNEFARQMSKQMTVFRQRLDNSWVNNNIILQQESSEFLAKSETHLSQVSLPVLSIWSGQWGPGSSWPFLPASFPHHQGDKIVYITPLATFLICTSIIQKKKKVSTFFVFTFPFYFSNTSSGQEMSSFRFFPDLLSCFFPSPIFSFLFSHHSVLFLLFLPLTHLTSHTSRRFPCLFFFLRLLSTTFKRFHQFLSSLGKP